jgi:hypothetical protein
MKWLVSKWTALRVKWALTPEQAEALAKIKFPCC